MTMTTGEAEAILADADKRDFHLSLEEHARLEQARCLLSPEYAAISEAGRVLSEDTRWKALDTCLLLFLTTEDGWCLHGATESYATERAVYLAEIAARGDEDHDPECCGQCQAMQAGARFQCALYDSEPVTEAQAPSVN